MNQDRDPFERLPGFVDPEPDPVVMHAVIAQSRDAFANRRNSSRRENFSLSNWLRRSAGWLATTGAAAAALTVVIVVAPYFGSTSPDGRDGMAERPVATPPNPTALSRGRDEVADGPPAGTRMGMQPGPGAGQAPIDPLPQLVSAFEGDGILIGTRLDATALEIYLPDISGEQTIDVQGVMPGEQIEILSAFAQPDRDLVAIHIRVNDVRFWRVYHLVDGKYGRDPERSKLVSDAVDRAEVERRLAEPDR